MGSIAKEDGVLKLVHPGRYVEIHKEPITAAEVLKRNPRHSITRPDVFQYPWVVVRRESVLNLGRVFFIVPNRTIYKLLKAHKEHHGHSSYQYQTSNDHVHQHVQKLNTPQKLAGAITKHPSNHRRLKQSSSFPMTSCIGTVTSPMPAYDKKLRKQSKVESWPKICKNKDTFLELKGKSEEDSTMKISHHKEYLLIDSYNTEEVSKRHDGDSECKYRKDVAVLKSCLRKQDSARHLLRLKVSFLLPANDEQQQQRRVQAS